MNKYDAPTVRAVSKSRLKKNMVCATKIADVVEPYTRDRRDVIGERKVRIKHKTDQQRQTVGGTE